MKIEQCFVIANVSGKSKLQHPPGRGGNLNNNFQKSQMPGGLPGGMLKLRFDRYITLMTMLQVPVNVSSIPDVRYHPVRVGISDAFVRYYRHLWRPGVIYRVFHIYSQVNITKNSVVNGSAVVFHPQTSLFFLKVLLL